MQLETKYSTIIVLVGTLIPAFLSLFFIFQLGLKTLFWDEWEMVPILELFFTGGNWIPTLNEFHNEHKMVFPKLIILGLAYFTSFNVFFLRFLLDGHF